MIAERRVCLVGNSVDWGHPHAYQKRQLESSGLALDEFLETKTDQRRVAFANKNGLLGVDRDLYEGRMSEPMEAWENMRLTMVSFSRAIVNIGSGRRTLSKPGSNSEAWRFGRPPSWEGCRSALNAGIAASYVASLGLTRVHCANDETWLNVQLQLNINEWLAHTTTIVFDFVERAPVVIPRCLAGELWLELAWRLASTPVDERVCPGCGRKFVARRPSQKWCDRTDRCRKRVERQSRRACTG